MNIRIFNVITHDGYILDKTGEHFLYFSADKKEFLRLYQLADCLLLDQEHFHYLTKVGVLPSTKKFVVVMSDYAAPKGMDNVWFTSLEAKQIKREIKIQGYSEVLCLINSKTTDTLVNQKIATEIDVAILHAIEGGGVEKIEINQSLDKKFVVTKTAGKNWERLNWVLKKN